MPTIDLGKVIGPPGPQGEVGPQGPQGVQGPQGPQGTPGKDASVNTYLPYSGGTMTGPVSMGGFGISDVGQPAADGDAANKQYVDKALEDKAPAGYGWGEGRPAIQFTSNNVNRTAVFVSAGEDMPTNDSAWLCEFYATSSDGSGNYGHMVATCQGGIAKGCICYRLRENGVYGEWEWLNPPMVLGVEYRTTELWNGKAVYTKCVDFGALPPSSAKSVNHGSTGKIFLGVRFVLNNNTPLTVGDGASKIGVSTTAVYLTTTTTFNNTATAQIWYTKD